MPTAVYIATCAGYVVGGGGGGGGVVVVASIFQWRYRS